MCIVQHTYCATHLLCNTPIVQHTYCATHLLCNTSIMATIHPQPSTHIWLSEHPPLETTIQERLNDIHYRACRLCEQYRVFIVICITCLFVISIVISVVLKNNNSSINACYYYSDSTLASDVSEECVNYLWRAAQCSTALESNPTWRWWIQSPQGLTMVKCNAVHKGPLCGAGSYNIIRNYIQMCNARYGQ